MGRICKYQYTHFIYPFVVEEKKYDKFLERIISDKKNWNVKLYDANADYDVYSFFLPYIKKFLFQPLFWKTEDRKNFKKYDIKKKMSFLKKMPCITFDYNLKNIKVGNVNTNGEEISFDISSIRLIVFEPGICFIDFKTEIEVYEKYINFDNILDFNYIFKEITPRGDTKIQFNKIRANKIDDIKSIASFIKRITDGYETEDIDRIYYDRMFTYSYVCLDKDEWNKPEDFKMLENDFYKLQYVQEGKSESLFNTECEKLLENRYSRWQYSMFGFSRESGVVMVSEVEKYNITKLPHDFEKVYIYMVLLGLYQRISLINFSQELLKSSQQRVKNMQHKLTKFVHFTWFSQITNSEHGTDLWKKWQQAFGLNELFEEVHKEYQEYYDEIVAERQNGINTVLMIVYIVSAVFAGLAVFAEQIQFQGTWMEPFLYISLIIAILSYPAYLVYKLFRRVKKVR